MLQAQTASDQWKTLLYVGSLVIRVAALHHMYVRSNWVQAAQKPLSSNLLKAWIELLVGMYEEDTSSSRS